MLQPKKTSFKKVQRNSSGQKIPNNSSLHFGEFGIKAQTAGQISAKTIETIRRTLSRTFKRSGKLWIPVFPFLVITKKPEETRMGKGKGAAKFWATRVKSGQILFEISGVSEEIVKLGVTLVSAKSPIPVLFIKRN